MEIVVVIFFILYLFYLGYRHKKSTTLNEFLVANKDLGAWRTALSTRSTGESGWLVLGLTGMGYTIGLHGIWIVIGETLMVAASWLFMAQKFKRLSDKYNSLTVVDYLEDRIGDTSGLIRILSSIIILILVPAYLAGQYSAVGKAFFSFLGVGAGVGTIAGAVIVTLYTLVGGFKAVTLTDLVQGLFMIFGLISVFAVLGINVSGGNVPIPTPDLPNHFWSIWGSHGFGWSGILAAISYLAIGLGFLGIPHIYVRFIAAANTGVIRRGTPIAIIFTLLGDGAALGIGILARHYLPELSDGEYVFPIISKTLFSPILVGLIMAVVLSAIMSTADSLLMLASSSIIRDVYQKLLNKEIEDGSLIRYARFVMIIISGVALIAGYGNNQLVFWMVLFAWSALGCAFNPIIILSLTNFHIGKYSAAIAMVSGCLTSVIWNVSLAKSTGVYEMIPGFIVGFSVAILGSKFENRK